MFNKAVTVAHYYKTKFRVSLFRFSFKKKYDFMESTRRFLNNNNKKKKMILTYGVIEYPY